MPMLPGRVRMNCPADRFRDLVLRLPVVGIATLAVVFVVSGGIAAAEEKPAKPKRIAAVVTEYRHNSHADVIVSRLFQTYTLDGKGDRPRMQLMSVFTDQI